MLYLFCNLFVDRKKLRRRDNFDDIDDSVYLALATSIGGSVHNDTDVDANLFERRTAFKKKLISQITSM